MSTKTQIRNDEYYKSIMCDALDNFLNQYPVSARPSVIVAFIHCLTNTVLGTMLLDHNLQDEVIEAVHKELNARQAIRATQLNLPLEP